MNGENEARMRAMVLRVERTTKAVFDDVVMEATRSIVEGSEITASPGQPVDTGALRASWHTDHESPTRATIFTNIAYAEAIEEGIGPHGPLTLRSQVGGFGSVKLTAAGVPRIVDVCVARQKGAA